MKYNVKKIIESKFFEKFITLVILLNAFTLGLETSVTIMGQYGSIISFVDRVFLSIFVLEILFKIFIYRKKFFTDPWCLFDFAVVLIALFPSQGAFSVLRALRVLRTLRLITTVESLRKVVTGLLSAIPGLGAVLVIMLLIYYVASVMATKLFSQSFPHFFGDLGKSAYSLFQVMTLESWSMGIVRPVMEQYPYAWLFFVPFIMLTTFTMLNLFIAVIVNSMQAETDKAAEQRATDGHNERVQMLHEIKSVKNELLEIKSLLNKK